MERTEYRAVIKFFLLEGLSATEIHDKMMKVLQESAPSFPTVHRWVVEIESGRTSVEDEPHSTCPKSATPPEIIEQVYDIICEDPSLTKREIADTIGITDERVFHILHEELHMKKLLGKFVPHSLTIQQKLNRKQISQRNLERFKKNRTDFVFSCVTMNETWIYHHNDDDASDCSATKQLKLESSKKKLLATIFWDAKGILLIDFSENRNTINSEYHCNLLEQLNEKIRVKRPALQEKTIILLQDNARDHPSVLMMAKLNELKYELLEHPPYSPDLAPSDCYLFTNLQKFLRGKIFSSNDDAITAVKQYFAELPENYYSDGIKLLENYWKRCIEVEGDYIE